MQIQRLGVSENKARRFPAMLFPYPAFHYYANTRSIVPKQYDEVAQLEFFFNFQKRLNVTYEPELQVNKLVHLYID